MDAVLFSSNSEKWNTPIELFDRLDRLYNFDLDPCADDLNHLCKLYFTKEVDGLSKDWSGHTVFCNPPYGKDISKWVEKCYNESRKPNTKVVALLPARTDTKWFHNFILNHLEVGVHFIKGRLHFSNSKNSAPFPSMIVDFNIFNYVCT